MRRPPHGGSWGPLAGDDLGWRLRAQVGWSLCRTGAFGKLGHGNRLAQNTPKVVVALQGKRVIQVSLGPHHSAALTQKGEVFTWGQAWGALSRWGVTGRPPGACLSGRRGG